MRLWTGPIIFLVVVSSLLGQREGRKPVLIRPDETPAPELEEPTFVPDPIKAREHLEIGDFYSRRGNFAAAADRYREAVRNAPKRAEAYEKLVQALERLERFSDAILVCEQFLEANSSSSEAKRFEKWAGKLREKSVKADRNAGG